MKPSLEVVCAVVIAVGGSIAALEASAAMPVAPPAPTTTPLLVQNVRSMATMHRFRHGVHHHFGLHHGRHGLHRGHR